MHTNVLCIRSTTDAFARDWSNYYLLSFGMIGSMAIDPSVLDSETMTLTARQFEAVRARVNTLTATMRRKMEQATSRKDVREVFSAPLSPQPVVSMQYCF